MSWIGKIAFFSIFQMMNTVLFFVTILRNARIPIFMLTVELKDGFIFGMAAQVVVLLGE